MAMKNVSRRVVAATLMTILTFPATILAKEKSAIGNLTSEKTMQEVDEVTTPKIVTSTHTIINAHSIGIGLGQTFLRGDFADQGDDKITFDALYSYSASYSFDMMLTAHYSEHQYRGQKVTLQGATAGIKSRLYNFDEFSPYVIGGVGFYHPKAYRNAGSDLKSSDGKTTFGIHLGAGVELKLNKTVAMGMLAQYHDPFDVKQDYGPEVSGSYAKLLLTVLYTFK